MAQNYYRTLFIDTINDYSMMAQFLMSQFLLAKFMNIAAKYWLMLNDTAFHAKPLQVTFTAIPPI